MTFIATQQLRQKAGWECVLHRGRELSEKETAGAVSDGNRPGGDVLHTTHALRSPPSVADIYDPGL